MLNNAHETRASFFNSWNSLKSNLNMIFAWPYNGVVIRFEDSSHQDIMQITETLNLLSFIIWRNRNVDKVLFIKAFNGTSRWKVQKENIEVKWSKWNILSEVKEENSSRFDLAQRSTNSELNVRFIYFLFVADRPLFVEWKQVRRRIDAERCRLSLSKDVTDQWTFPISFFYSVEREMFVWLFVTSFSQNEVLIHFRDDISTNSRFFYASKAQASTDVNRDDLNNERTFNEVCWRSLNGESWLFYHDLRRTLNPSRKILRRL